jgi:hypothetical protein
MMPQSTVAACMLLLQAQAGSLYNTWLTFDVFCQSDTISQVAIKGCT